MKALPPLPPPPVVSCLTHPFSITDERTRALVLDATDRQRHAHRPGTIAGRESAVRLFLSFCDQLQINYKRLAFHHVCWYIEHMARQGHAPLSISNAISHLRTFYLLAGLDTQPLHHFRVGLALRAVATTVRHTPTPKDPVPPALLKRALEFLHKAQSPQATRLAIILMFMGFLRQSSVAPQSVAAYDHTRHLTASDLSLVPEGLVVHIKWTKTLQRSADATSILLPPTADTSLCPVRAYHLYRREVPAPSAPQSPLLVHADGNALTVPFIRKQWTLLLQLAGADPAKYSLHSLRKGAANYTYNEARADLNDVMTHGTWRSQAVRTYIKPHQGPQNSVYHALKRL